MTITKMTTTRYMVCANLRERCPLQLLLPPTELLLNATYLNRILNLLLSGEKATTTAAISSKDERLKRLLMASALLINSELHACASGAL